ncbi:sensor histidine kinase [Flexibacterium corallicola]|uniref:sensor histidine kinase n=1 Tax=Flexibacterium corallicola TaxID=3037259 RepID=UPI00286EC078|nr:ATP-binding protein [Pseudovibrio sp. M1P-2-3]
MHIIRHANINSARSPHWRTPVVMLAVLLTSLIAGALTWVMCEQKFLEDVGEKGLSTLSVQSANLEQHLDKFRLLAPILARSGEVKAAFKNKDVRSARRIARLIAGMSGADEVWFFSPETDFTVTNLLSRDALANKGRFAAPEAFKSATQGRLGRQLIVRGSNKQTSYVFAFAVREREAQLGIIAVRVSLSGVEQTWALSANGVFAVDESGHIVASNRPELRGRRFAVTEQKTTSAPPDQLNLVRGRTLLGLELFQASELAPAAPLLKLEQTVAPLGWRVLTFIDVSNARTLAIWISIATAAFVLGSSLGVWGLWQRRRRLLLLMYKEKAIAQELEQRVDERTTALLCANKKLEQEVRERKNAEEELQKVQAGLIQSAKLATLGEMSAALSHEYNQPLGAIRSHADNAQTYLQMGKQKNAGKSLDRIVSMVERMATLSKTLKGFSRKAGDGVQPVLLAPVFDEVFLLVGPRCRQMNVDLQYSPPGEGVVVMGGAIRLSQVLVNLIGNALDALGPVQNPCLKISVTQATTQVFIAVEDNGAGIPKQAVQQIFDPFFTTKEAGHGVGLGLSISYKIIRDFGGSLEYSKSKQGGACFTLALNYEPMKVEG